MTSRTLKSDGGFFYLGCPASGRMTMKKWFRGASDYQVRVVVAVAIAILGFALWSAVGYFHDGAECGASCNLEFSSQRR
jgi:hypothetical protein